MKILGIAGLQGSGKDYLHDRLAEMMPGVRRIGLADGVRREVVVDVLNAVGVDVGTTDGAGTWRKPYTAGQRFILQHWGTEFRRAQDPDYWVNYAFSYMVERHQPGDLWAITDVRFANEAEAIQDGGGKVVLVQASLKERAKRLGLTMLELDLRSEHPSEQIDFETDYVVSSYADGLHMDERLVKWLGFPPSCIKCQAVVQHIYHDNGTLGPTPTPDHMDMEAMWHR